MENPIEAVEHNFKGLPKWAKIAIPSAIGIIIILGVARARKGGVTAPAQSLGTSSQSSSMASQAYDLTAAQRASAAALMDAQKVSDQQNAAKIDAVAAGLNQTLTSSLSGIQQQLSSDVFHIQDDLTKQASANSAAIAGFGSQINSILKATGAAAQQPEQHQAVIQHFADSYNPASAPSSSNPTSIIGDSGVMSSTYGNGGADYNTASDSVKASIAQNEQRLASDSSFVTSEKQRTADVIAFRQSQGLDTSEQVTYQNKLAAM